MSQSGSVVVGPAEVYAALYDAPPEDEQEFVRWVAQTFHGDEVARVLDMGCGTGRLLAGLAAQDWQVVGYEPNPDYAEAARRVARDLPGVDVVKGGFLDLVEERTFDVIFAINDLFAYQHLDGPRMVIIARAADS
ncbi:MAG TPA: class I SAM-dependent methyltransferase [Mycobacteriales bacterium]|nr:class I SAM-dependent methyltransferase [Mycobacteriales bacterium]